jgi:hypothetical protein
MSFGRGPSRGKRVRHGIEPPWVPWMTAADALGREPPSAQYPESPNGCYRIRGAGGPEATRGPQDRRDNHLVRPDDADGRAPGYAGQSGRSTHSRAIFRASNAPASASSIAAGGAVAIPGRDTSATSWPSHGPPARRQASRMTRLHRLRMTALPILRPATKTTRPSGPHPSGDGPARTTRRGRLARRPDLNKRSMSDGAVIVRTPAPDTGDFSRRLRAEDRAALAAPCGQHAAAAAGRHAHPEPVGLGAPAVVRLERSLHTHHSIQESGSFSARRSRHEGGRAGAKPSDCSRALAGVSTIPPTAGPRRPATAARAPCSTAPAGPAGPSKSRSEIGREIVDTVENAGFMRAQPVDNAFAPIVGRWGLC